MKWPKIEPRDVPVERAVQRLGLTMAEFKLLAPELHARGLPRPDQTTGKMDLKAIEDWMDRRSGLAGLGPAKDASVLVADRLRAYRGSAGRAGQPKSDSSMKPDRPLADGEVIIERQRRLAHPHRKMRERNFELAVEDGFVPPSGWKLHPDKKR